MWPEGSRRSTMVAAPARSPRQRLDITGGAWAIETDLKIHPDRHHTAERAEDHHHYRDGAATTRQWQDGLKRPKRKTRTARQCQRPRMWTGTVESHQLADDDQLRVLLDVQRWRQPARSLQAALTFYLLGAGQDRDVTFTLAPDRQRHRRERAEDHLPLPWRQQRHAPVAKTRLKRPKENISYWTATCRQRPRMQDGTVESYQLVAGWCDRRQLDVQRWRQLQVPSPQQRLWWSQVKIETWPLHTPRPTTTQAERAGRPSPRRDGNDAPVAKDATETTEENTVLNGNVPAGRTAHRKPRHSWFTMWPKAALTFNDDGSHHRSPRQTSDDSLGWVKIDAPATPRPTTRRERAEDHHHYRDGQQTTRQWQKTRLKRPKKTRY